MTTVGRAALVLWLLVGSHLRAWQSDDPAALAKQARAALEQLLLMPQFLGERLGPVLLQFPPTRQKNLTLLDSLLSALGRPAAAEFRHESWFAEETYRVLREHAGALVVTDEAKWPRAPLVDLGAVAYFRLRRGYTAASLRPWVADVASALAAHEEVHVYFKHDLGSPALARRLLGLAAKESAPR